VGGLILDRSRREAEQEGRLLPLTKREFLLLECLMRNVGRSVTRERLIETAWGLEAEVSDGSLDFQVHGLRGKLVAQAGGSLIRTVRGVGYRMEE
jgi:DNA-binding response OmpR family regulator